ncbi:MAG: YkvA family protein [Candidatus Riflebacteria bacterium]|jgi:uncharacterized membrane protein YkvA (DUF1232 family)|nr:YkvA family protein [Candidatus Riflebacteria bacterium]
MPEKGPSIPKALLKSPTMQVILFVITLAYVVFPVDVIPDVLPVIGWLDDLAVFITQISVFFMYVHEKRKQAAAKQQSGPGEGGSNGR